MSQIQHGSYHGHDGWLLAGDCTVHAMDAVGVGETGRRGILILLALGPHRLREGQTAANSCGWRCNELYVLSRKYMAYIVDYIDVLV